MRVVFVPPFNVVLQKESHEAEIVCSATGLEQTLHLGADDEISLKLNAEGIAVLITALLAVHKQIRANQLADGTIQLEVPGANAG